MKYEDIIRNPEILEYYQRGNENLGALGYTDHSVAHTHLVAGKSAEIMLAFGYASEEAELAKIAGFLHDIGNAINRNHHAEYGALLANEIFIENYTDPHFYGWAIEREGRMIGNIGAYDYDSKKNQIEVGFSIERASWGKGYAAEALEAKRNECGRLPDD